MPVKQTHYGLPEADQLIQCSGCKQYVEVCDAVSIDGQEYCGDCESLIDSDDEYESLDLSLLEDTRDQQKEEAFIRKHLQGEFEDDDEW